VHWSTFSRVLPSPRRAVPALAVTASLAATALAGVWVGTASAGDPDPTTQSQEQGMVSGRPLQDPVDAASSPGTALTVTLDAAGARLDVAGRPVWGEAYNGTFIAPTIHVRPGSQVTVVLVNHLPVATNLHFHGLHVSPSADSDNSFLCAEPGATLTYHLAIPADHPQGTYWYHSHAMGTSCTAPGSYDMAGMDDMADMPAPAATAPAAGTTPGETPGFVPGDVENQIFAGMSGALLVGDDRSLLPPPLRGVTAHTLVLKDVQLDPAGAITQNTATTEIDSDAPTVRLVDGQLRPVIAMRPHETQLWRLVNAGADIFYDLALDGSRFTVIGQDGVPVSRVTTAGSLLLPPGARYDVLVTAGALGTTLRTLAYGNGPDGDSYPDTVLASVAVGGRPARPAPPVTGALPTAPADLAGAPVATRRTVELTEDEPNGRFFIDGRQFTMDAGSIFDTPAHLGTVEEWTLVNRSGEDHPFHLHATAFQVVSVGGVPSPYTHDQDVMAVPHQVGDVPGEVVIRIAFRDHPGRYMFHCHIAAHEDNGMMSYIDVVP
jgi:suppressor of ftsI